MEAEKEIQCRRCGDLKAPEMFRASWRRILGLGRLPVCIACQEDKKKRTEAAKTGVCAMCGNVRRLTREHLVPRCRGGTLCVMACSWCNANKGDKSLAEWLRGLPPLAPQHHFCRKLLALAEDPSDE
jgi:hypothetical protein